MVAIRYCDGQLLAGTDANGDPCKCGKSFDDFQYEVRHPHAPISWGIRSAVQAGFHAGTAPTHILAGTSVYPSTWSYYPGAMGVYPPNAETFSKAEIDQLAKAYSTLVAKDETIVICVDNDVSQQTVNEIASTLSVLGIKGIVIRGARAGKGHASILPFGSTERDERIDILVRLGDLWEQRPDLNFSDLLCWYKGETMTDDDFASAAEAHFEKVFGGIYGEHK